METRQELIEKQAALMLKEYLMQRRQAILAENDKIERLLGFSENERTSQLRKESKRKQ